MPKSARKAQRASAAQEREDHELEELKARLREETEADMEVLRALMDAEKQARGIEQAANDYEVGVEWRVSESMREIDAREDKEISKLVAQDEAEAKRRADAQIAAVQEDVRKKRDELTGRFEQHREQYVDKVFNLVIGAEDE